MRRMRLPLRCALACVVVAAVGCKRRSAPARHSDGGAAEAAVVTTRPNAPVIVQCPATGCPADDAGPPRDGGELVVHVEAEPASCATSSSTTPGAAGSLENQIVETLLFQEPDAARSRRVCRRFDRASRRRAHAPPAPVRQVARRHAVLRRRRRLHHRPRARSRGRRRSAHRLRAGLRRRDARRRHGRPAAHASGAVLRRRRWRTSPSSPSTYIRVRTCAAPTPRTRRSAPGRSSSSRWKQGDELVVERNPDYWGPKAHLERIRFRFVRDREVACELYRRGELDVLWQRAGHPLRRGARGDAALAGHRLLVWTPRAYFFIVWNTRARPARRSARAARADDARRPHALQRHRLRRPRAADHRAVRAGHAVVRRRRSRPGRTIRPPPASCSTRRASRR